MFPGMANYGQHLVCCLVNILATHGGKIQPDLELIQCSCFLPGSVLALNYRQLGNLQPHQLSTYPLMLTSPLNLQ